MPFTYGTKARVYLNGYNLSPYLQSITFTKEQENPETTTLTKTAKTRIPGPTDGSLSAEGFFDGGVNAADQILREAFSPDLNLWAYFPQGDIWGTYGQGLTARVASYEVTSPVDGVTEVSVEAAASLGIQRVQILHILRSEVANGNDTSVDHGAASTGGGLADLHIMVNTTAGITVTLQHSADNVTYVGLASFQPTSVRSAQRVEIPKGTTINRYVRAAWTVALGGGEATFHVSFSRAV